MALRPLRHEGARWLVLLLDGVRRADLTPETTPHLCEVVDGGPWTNLRADLERGPVREFFDALPARDLRRDGLELDRRSFCLRPDWQGDRSVVDSLTYRPRGRADATVLWLRDAGRAAVEAGLGTDGHRQALAELDRDAFRAIQMMRRDDRAPHVVAAILEPLREADRAFDLVAAVRRCLPRSVARKLSLDVRPSHARIVCDSMHEVALCSARLTTTPFSNHGTLLTPAELDRLGFARRPDRLVFAPHERVALGPRGTRAAGVLSPAPAGQAVRAAWLDADSASITATELATRIAERVRAELQPVAVDRTPIRQAIGDFPDLLQVLEHDLQHALGLAHAALDETVDASAD